RRLPLFSDKLLCDRLNLDKKSRVQARFLLGPAGSGKTFRCLAEIRTALRECAEGPPLILLAPKQATFQLERQLLDSEWRGERPREPKMTSSAQAGVSPHELSGYTRLHIFSFERLAQFAFEKLHVTPPQLLAEEGRVMVLRARLMQHENELKLFRRSARRAGFAQQLSRLLGELQQHQFTPAKLRTFASRLAGRRELQDKLHDLALLLDAYAHRLIEHELQDANHLLNFATTALLKKSRTPDPKSVARRFRGNDAAGTGLARRHFAALRTRHARVLPRKRAWR